MGLLPDLIGPVAPLHAIGGAKDLPIPASLAMAAGSAALIVSFCVLTLAWRTPRYAPDSVAVAGTPVPLRVLDTEGWRWFLRVLGLIGGGYATWALVWGPDVLTNPTFGIFYVLVWVGLVPASLLFGRIVAALSPLRTLFLVLSKALGADPRKGAFTYPARLGYWPAAVGLFAFVWQELVNPQTAYLTTVRPWLAVYAAVLLIGAALFGEAWFARADPFEVYSNLVARLSPWARDTHGRLVVRSPLANLATVTPRPGLVAVVGVLLGSTAFDSFKETVHWRELLRNVGGNPEYVNALGLLGFCVLIGGAFALATLPTGIEAGDDAPLRRHLPRLFAHSVIPIIVGYIVAHYLSYFVEQGQLTLIQLSNPMVKQGVNLLGTGDWPVNYWLSFHPTFLAWVKVLAIVAGHVVGVVAAHDKALQLLPKKHQVTGQLGLLVIMIAFTSLGLWLLFGAKTVF